MATPDNPSIDPGLLKDPAFQRVLADALQIQDRFSAKPVYARTGKGHLKSVGVAELQTAKMDARVREKPPKQQSGS